MWFVAANWSFPLLFSTVVYKQKYYPYLFTGSLLRQILQNNGADIIHFLPAILKKIILNFNYKNYFLWKYDAESELNLSRFKSIKINLAQHLQRI